MYEGKGSSQMKLANGDRAYVDLRKLEAYCLNMHHPRGKHEALVFASCGVTDAEALKRALLQAAASFDAIESESDRHGVRYIVDFRWMDVLIRSIWMVRKNEDFPRLVSCYIP
jgi:hypothetical protein